jgi:hypothetical protein
MALTDRIQAAVDTDLIDAELQACRVEVAGSRDGDVVGEVVAVVLLGRSCRFLDWLVVPVVCAPQIEGDSTMLSA